MFQARACHDLLALIQRELMAPDQDIAVRITENTSIVSLFDYEVNPRDIAWTVDETPESSMVHTLDTIAACKQISTVQLGQLHKPLPLDVQEIHDPLDSQYHFCSPSYHQLSEKHSNQAL